MNNARIDRAGYAKRYGPTVGDRVRLGDSDLVIEIEKNLIEYGEELKTGGFGNVNDITPFSRAVPLDLVISNVILFDYRNIVKADIGIRGGKIIGIGNAGVPELQVGVSPSLAIGPDTIVIDGANKILTPGIIDIGFAIPDKDMMSASLASGVTTQVFIQNHLKNKNDFRFDGVDGRDGVYEFYKNNESWPQNFAVIANALPELVSESVSNGAAGLYVYLNNRESLNVLKECLDVGSEGKIPVYISSSIRNNAFNKNQFFEALSGRTVNMLCPGGMMGSTVDYISYLSHENIIPMSFSFSHAWKVFPNYEKTIEMTLKIHGEAEDDYNKDNDYFCRKEILRAEELLLTYYGNIPSTASGGIFDEDISNVVQDALDAYTLSLRKHGNQAGDSSRNCNNMAKRLISQLTINPAMAYGINSYVGSLDSNKRADLLLWDADSFGKKPSMVIIGGNIASSASLISEKQYHYVTKGGARFVSKESDRSGLFQGIQSDFLAVDINNTLTMNSFETCNFQNKSIVVNDETYEVRVDGVIMGTNYESGRPTPPQGLIPGEVFTDNSEIFINSSYTEKSVTVSNCGKNDIFIGSHTLASDFSDDLSFDRSELYRLNTLSGESIRINPGQSRTLSFLIKKNQ